MWLIGSDSAWSCKQAEDSIIMDVWTLAHLLMSTAVFLSQFGVYGKSWWTLCCHFYSISSHSHSHNLSLQQQHCHNLWATATAANLATVHTRDATVIPIFQSLFLAENLNTTLALSLICNMPSFIELRDHHSWIQGRGLHLMLRGGWCFIFYGSHFYT